MQQKKQKEELQARSLIIIKHLERKLERLEVQTRVRMELATKKSSHKSIVEQNILIILIISSTIIAFIVSLILSKKITTPIKELMIAADRLGEGDLSFRVKKIESDDETEELARSFNEMAHKLEISTVSKKHVDTIIDSMQNSMIVLDNRLVHQRSQYRHH